MRKMQRERGAAAHSWSIFYRGGDMTPEPQQYPDEGKTPLSGVSAILAKPTLLYTLALLLLALAAVASHAVLVRSLAELDEDSLVINTSGRQRMLSEQTFRLAGTMLTAQSIEEDARLKRELRASTSLMRESHEALVARARSASARSQWDRAVLTAYFEQEPSLDTRLTAYFAALESLLATGPDATSARRDAYRILANAHREGLLRDLDQLVAIYENRARARLQEARELHVALMFGMLILLLLEALFVFRPLMRRQRQARDALRTARDKARSELAARTNILAAVSHEIRTPLGGVLGIIDQLKRERSAAEGERALRLMEDSCQALLETLDAILERAKLAQDAGQRQSRPFAPAAVAQRVAELFRPLARRKAIRIEVPATCDRQAIGDPARIQQMLANLVSNAVKFTQSGAVTIDVRPPPAGANDWTFIVSDTGAGMDQKRIATIFDAFDTSGADSLGRSVGAGLGLSITRELVDGMGGHIDVHSTPGQGSVFTIVLPLEETIEDVPQGLKDGRAGRVHVAIAKATQQIQIEALVSQAGWTILDVDQKEGVREAETAPLVIVSDASKMHGLPSDLPSDLIEKCALVIILDAAEGAALPPALQNRKVTFMTGEAAMRALPEILAEAIDERA